MFVIKTPIGDGYNSNASDIKQIRRALVGLGYEDNNLDFEFIDRQLDENIRAFQRDNGLKIDGLILPEGETTHTIRKVMVRSPSSWCKGCGGPHGGSKGDLCPDCDLKK